LREQTLETVEFSLKTQDKTNLRYLSRFLLSSFWSLYYSFFRWFSRYFRWLFVLFYFRNFKLHSFPKKQFRVVSHTFISMLYSFYQRVAN